MAFVTLALVLVPCLIAGEESALGWGRARMAAKSGAQGATDTQTASGERPRMATELQRVAGQFKYDKGTIGAATSEFRLTVGQGHDSHLASRLNAQVAPTAARIQ